MVVAERNSFYVDGRVRQKERLLMVMSDRKACLLMVVSDRKSLSADGGVREK